MADRRHRLAGRRERRDLRLEHLAREVLLHPWRVSAGQHERVVGRRLDRAPRDGRAHLLRRGHLCVEALRLSLRPELAEHHARDQQRIARGHRARLGREHHVVPGAREHAPRDGRLGGIEVVIGEGDEDARHRGRPADLAEEEAVLVAPAARELDEHRLRVGEAVGAVLEAAREAVGRELVGLRGSFTRSRIFFGSSGVSSRRCSVTLRAVASQPSTRSLRSSHLQASSGARGAAPRAAAGRSGPPSRSAISPTSRLVARAREPLVEREPHADVGDVVLGQERRRRRTRARDRPRARPARRAARATASSSIWQNRSKPTLATLPRLLGAEQIAGAAQLEVERRDLEARSRARCGARAPRCARAPRRSSRSAAARAGSSTRAPCERPTRPRSW